MPSRWYCNNLVEIGKSDFLRFLVIGHFWKLRKHLRYVGNSPDVYDLFWWLWRFCFAPNDTIYIWGICYVTLLFPFTTITPNDLQYNNVLVYYYTHFSFFITILLFYFAQYYNITSYFVNFYYITLFATAILTFHAHSCTPCCITCQNDPLTCHLRCLSLHGFHSNPLSTHWSCIYVRVVQHLSQHIWFISSVVFSKIFY